MPELPKHHNAIVYDKLGTTAVKTVQVPTPTPGHGQVLVELSHSGICHSDLAVAKNAWWWLPDLPADAQQVGGHEGVGTVVALGPGVEELQAAQGSDAGSVKLGDRVGIKWYSSCCLRCAACTTGLEGSCFAPRISGYHVPGTFQQFALAPAHYVTPIPDGVPADAAAPMLCGGLTVYSAYNKARVRPGDWVVVPGAGGGLGSLAVEMGARGMGLRVLGVDLAAKRELVLGCGAEAFVALDDAAYARPADLEAEVLRLTGGSGAAAAIVCTASNGAYAQALRFLRFHGTLVVVGIPEGAAVPIASADPGTLILKQLVVAGSAVGSRREAVEVLDLVARGVVRPRVRVVKPDGLAGVFEEMERGTMQGRAVMRLDAEAW